MHEYNILWNEQSAHAGESMPLGGFDTGCNVWVENNQLLIYASQSSAFDEERQLIKAGRLRITLNKPLLSTDFSQELRLATGDILIKGRGVQILLWADVNRSAVHIEIEADEAVETTVCYELWRDGDTVIPSDGRVVFYHRNTREYNLLDERLAEQGIEHLKKYFPDVERNRTCGGALVADGFVFSGTGGGRYINHDFRSHILKTPAPRKKTEIILYLHTAQTATADEWARGLSEKEKQSKADKNARAATLAWWKAFWARSYVRINPDAGPEDADWQVGRNYQLFRYMLAANVQGEYPTKFNGGLFTVDAEAFFPPNKASPDHRDWEGFMFTAQNQRLVYWGMIKNGDFDVIKPAFEFYRRLTEPMKHRTKHFFGLEDSACFCEQIDANGLSAYYGRDGIDYALQLRHHYVEALEFCFMILTYHSVSGNDISDYTDFILSVINFYDYKYNKFDERGKRIIFPSTALETYHGAPVIHIYGKEGPLVANYNDEETAVTNPADVISALDDTLAAVLKTKYLDDATRRRLARFKSELPPIPTEHKNGHTVIAPCEYPKVYHRGNGEIPQLNTVYPYNTYGINRPNLQLARDTYDYAWDSEEQLFHFSWHPNGIYAARIANVPEAVKYMRLKMADSGRKFPAFWGPGHDYTPDHNWGGSGMIGVQEMLLQNLDGKLYILPAWDRACDVCYKLWADERTIVEVEYKKGTLSYSVTPPERAADVVVPFWE